MFLKKIKYKTFNVLNADTWEIDEVLFNKFNLIVGKNAV